MATKKGSKKKTEEAVEEVVEELVEEAPVVEEAPAPKKETKKEKATPKKKELPDHVGYAGTPEEYTTEVFGVLLDREPKEVEMTHYVGLVKTHGFPLNEIVHQIKKGGEYQGKHGTYL